MRYQPLAHVYGCSCRACRGERRRLTRAESRRSHGTHWWDEPVERVPAGDRGVLKLHYQYRGTPPLEEFLSFRWPDRPWLMTGWEKLRIHAPNPSLCRPWCCYINTVIFYVRPHQTLPPTRYLTDLEFLPNGETRRLERRVIKRNKVGSFATYGSIETSLSHETIVEHAGELFDVQTWRIIWCRPSWWVRYTFRRRRPEEQRRAS